LVFRQVFVIMINFRRILFTLTAAGSLLAQTPADAPKETAPPLVTIDQAIREAIDHNLGLVAERLNVPLAEARLITARLRPNPVLTVDGDYLDILGTGFGPENQAGPAEAAIRTDFVLERGKKRENRIAVAELGKSVAELNVLNTLRGVILDVQNAFVDVLLAKESLALAQENLKALNAIVEVNTNRVRAGDLAQVELVRSRLAALQFQNAARQGEFRLQSARHRLQLLMGRREFTHGFTVQGDMRKDPEFIDIHPLRDIAQKLRPDLQAIQRDQARSAADLRLQIAQGKVDYTVGTVYHRQQSPTGTGNSMGFYLSVPIPVFNRNQGEIERARLEHQQLEARINALRASIAAEVETAYEQYSTSRSMVDSLEKDMLQQARDVRNTTEYSYRRGEASLIEFLDAQRAYNDTIQSYNEARADYARSLYQIDSISGKAVNP
jgi:cobalt-zinc-cadmium efflux system outer membrane protein